MDFSPITEAVVLFSVPAVLWHLLILRGFAGSGPRGLAATTVIMLVLIATAWLLVRSSVLGVQAADAAWLPLLTVGGAVLIGLVAGDRLLGGGVPQQILLAVQLFRPIGLVFVLEDARGVLPSSFAQPAGWGDLLAGAIAAAVLWRHPTGPVPARLVVLVAVVGLADFTSAFVFGLTSSDLPIQLFAFDNPTRVLEWPTGFIPVLLVPYAVLMHILSLRQMRGDASASRTRAARLGSPVAL